jgi:hypothetical protein
MAATSARVEDLTKFSERFPLSTLMQLPRPDELLKHKIPDFPLLMLFKKKITQEISVFNHNLFAGTNPVDAHDSGDLVACCAIVQHCNC